MKKLHYASLLFLISCTNVSYGMYAMGRDSGQHLSVFLSEKKTNPNRIEKKQESQSETKNLNPFWTPQKNFQKPIEKTAKSQQITSKATQSESKDKKKSSFFDKMISFFSDKKKNNQSQQNQEFKIIELDQSQLNNNNEVDLDVYDLNDPNAQWDNFAHPISNKNLKDPEQKVEFIDPKQNVEIIPCIPIAETDDFFNNLKKATQDISPEKQNAKEKKKQSIRDKPTSKITEFGKIENFFNQNFMQNSFKADKYCYIFLYQNELLNMYFIPLKNIQLEKRKECGSHTFQEAFTAHSQALGLLKQFRSLTEEDFKIYLEAFYKLKQQEYSFSIKEIYRTRPGELNQNLFLFNQLIEADQQDLTKQFQDILNKKSNNKLEDFFRTVLAFSKKDLKNNKTQYTPDQIAEIKSFRLDFISDFFSCFAKKIDEIKSMFPKNINEKNVPKNINENHFPENINENHFPENINENHFPENINENHFPENINKNLINNFNQVEEQKKEEKQNLERLMGPDENCQYQHSQVVEAEKLQNNQIQSNYFEMNHKELDDLLFYLPNNHHNHHNIQNSKDKYRKLDQKQSQFDLKLTKLIIEYNKMKSSGINLIEALTDNFYQINLVISDFQDWKIVSEQKQELFVQKFKKQEHRLLGVMNQHLESQKHQNTQFSLAIIGIRENINDLNQKIPVLQLDFQNYKNDQDQKMQLLLVRSDQNWLQQFSKNQEYDSHIASITLEIKNFQKSLITCQENHLDLLQVFKTSQNENQNWRKTVESSLGLQKQDIQMIERSNAILRDNVGVLKNNIDVVHTDLKQENQGMKSNLNNLELVIEKNAKKNQVDLKALEQKLINYLNQKEQRIDNLSVQNRKLTDDVTSLKNRIQQIQNDHSVQNRKLTDDVTSLKNRIQQIQNDHSVQNEQLKEYVNSLQQNIQQNQKDHRIELENQELQHQQQHQKTHQTIQNMQSEIDLFPQRIAELQQQSEAQKDAQNQIMQALSAELNQQIAQQSQAHQNDNNAMDLRINHQSIELNAAQKEIIQFKNKIQSMLLQQDQQKTDHLRSLDFLSKQKTGTEVLSMGSCVPFFGLSSQQFHFSPNDLRFNHWNELEKLIIPHLVV